MWPLFGTWWTQFCHGIVGVGVVSWQISLAVREPEWMRNTIQNDWGFSDMGYVVLIWFFPVKSWLDMAAWCLAVRTTSSAQFKKIDEAVDVKLSPWSTLHIPLALALALSWWRVWADLDHRVTWSLLYPWFYTLWLAFNNGLLTRWGCLHMQCFIDSFARGLETADCEGDPGWTDLKRNHERFRRDANSLWAMLGPNVLWSSCANASLAAFFAVMTGATKAESKAQGLWITLTILCAILFLSHLLPCARQSSRCEDISDEGSIKSLAIALMDRCPETSIGMVAFSLRIHNLPLGVKLPLFGKMDFSKLATLMKACATVLPLLVTASEVMVSE